MYAFQPSGCKQAISIFLRRVSKQADKTIWSKAVGLCSSLTFLGTLCVLVNNTMFLSISHCNKSDQCVCLGMLEFFMILM